MAYRILRITPSAIGYLPFAIGYLLFAIFVLIRFSNSRRAIKMWRPHVSHFKPMSAPKRVTVHS